jgi:hypothetical protein
MFHRSAIQQFQSPAEKALLDILTTNGFAKVETVRMNTLQGPRSVPVLTYRDTLKPYVRETYRAKGKTPRAKAAATRKTSEEEGSLFKLPFSIAIATRQLKSIDYKNAYQGEIPLAGVKTDFYAVTFSYLLKEDLPGLPKCDRVFKGNAKAFFDPDTGVWKAEEVKLEDDGADEYMKLLGGTTSPSRSIPKSPAKRKVTEQPKAVEKKRGR